MNGYHYMVEAIEVILSSDIKVLRGKTIMLYELIAKRYKSTTSNVERSIRHAVISAFKIMPTEVVANIFGNSVLPGSESVANTQFIMTLVEYIRDNHLRPDSCEVAR